MSEDGDVDVESSEDVPEIGEEAIATTADNGILYGRGSHERRAHHNALERRRRDHIKDSFSSLRDCIPSLVGEKVSRAHVLNKATEYIRHMQKSGSTREEDICDLARKNEVLEEQVRALEDAKARGSLVNAEEMLQNVAARVQSRQTQEQQQQMQAKNNTTKPKHQGGGGGASEASKNSSATSAKLNASLAPVSNDRIGTRTTATTKGMDTPTSTSTSSSQLLPGSINFLANNFRNTQNFLTALQKSGNIPRNIQSLAACVLASPLVRGQTRTTQASTLPRGIVTATTVPKCTNSGVGGSAVVKSSSSVLVTGNTVSIQQQKTADSAAQVTPPVTLTTLVENALKSTEHDTTDTTTTTTSATHTQLSQADQTNPPHSNITNSLIASQLLEMRNILQQQGAPKTPSSSSSASCVSGSTGLETGGGGRSVGVSHELLASLLNLPSLSVAATAPISTSGLPLSSQGSPSSQATPTDSHKRPAPSNSIDVNFVSEKKFHLEQ